MIRLVISFSDKSSELASDDFISFNWLEVGLVVEVVGALLVVDL